MKVGTMEPDVPYWALQEEHRNYVIQLLRDHCILDYTTQCWIYKKNKKVTLQKEWHKVTLDLAVLVACIDRGTATLGGSVYSICGNEACYSPSHLIVSKEAPTSVSYTASPRRPVGEAHSTSVLTDTEVKTICFQYRLGLGSLENLGNKYGVDKTTILSIISGRTWGHITNGVIQTPLTKHSNHRNYDGMNKGENNGKAKLTEELVYKMRCEYYAARGSLPYKCFAENYGVSNTACRGVIIGTSWKHVAFPEGMQEFLQTRA